MTSFYFTNINNVRCIQLGVGKQEIETNSEPFLFPESVEWCLSAAIKTFCQKMFGTTTTTLPQNIFCLAIVILNVASATQVRNYSNF